MTETVLTESRATLLTGGHWRFGDLVIVQLTFKSLITASNTPNMGTPFPIAKYDSALQCIDITDGLSENIAQSIPCGISAMNGALYIKAVEIDHIYAVTGVYKSNVFYP